ncbi:hypothetical protein [Oceanobacillus senegalensis]|uniref:hypothetical protein n=1 Tax=Oceanobacillus senegalensis TaxID=1936063 RepID=UPI000A30C04C|nr:hypothetical protein [Oceanobacillus senegalensis]
MFQIRYGYEYGIIEFRVVFVNSSNFQQIVVCHRLSISAITQANFIDPNQPIRVHIQNGTSGGTFTAIVRGRYYAILGSITPTNRITAERRLRLSATANAMVPTVSFRRKSIFPDGTGQNNSINVQILNFDIISSADIVWQLRLGSNLTGANFGDVSETPTSETCCLSDVSATAIDTRTGIKILSGLTKGGQRSTVENFPVDIVLSRTTPVTLAVMSISGNATIDVNFRVHEDW